MAGYQNRYGEDIRSMVMKQNQNYIKHYDEFGYLKIEKLYGNNSGSEPSTATYEGETETPSQITQREADKEAEFQGGFQIRRGIPKKSTQRERNRMMIEAEAHRQGLKGVAKLVSKGAELAKFVPGLSTGAEVVGSVAELGDALLGDGSCGCGSGKGSKRADVVKKIMKERGVSMIEASKIVKNEGLYKGKSGGNILLKNAERAMKYAEARKAKKELEASKPTGGRGRSGGMNGSRPRTADLPIVGDLTAELNRRRAQFESIKLVKNAKEALEKAEKEKDKSNKFSEKVSLDTLKSKRGIEGQIAKNLIAQQNKLDKLIESLEKMKMTMEDKPAPESASKKSESRVAEASASSSSKTPLDEYKERLRGMTKEERRAELEKSTSKLMERASRPIEGEPAPGELVKDPITGSYKKYGTGKKKRGRPKKVKVMENVDVRMDDMEPMEGGKKRKNKKEKKGESDPTIDKLLGGQLIIKANKGSSMSGGAKRKTSDKMKKRAELVKKLMKERNISLAEASKAIKNEGLSY